MRARWLGWMVVLAVGCADGRRGELDAGTSPPSDGGPPRDDAPIAEDAAPQAECEDRDGDGYGLGCGLGEDCDDARSDVSPDAPEACDGVTDHDCDATVDEGCGCIEGTERGCGGDVGACEAGTSRCAGGVWGACQGAVGPRPERCEGAIDEDCDAVVDEGCGCVEGAEQRCGDDVGACEAGVARCAGGAWGACEGAIGPRPERCDGSGDEDCDGAVDEGCGCVEGDERACGSSVGECWPGTQRCAGGAWGACAGEVGPRAEVCDGGHDEDCDGVIDDGCACVDDDTQPCGSDVGACIPGLQRCVAGAWATCEGAVLPSGERCDGSVDDDCDGVVDDGCVCTDGSRRACGSDVGACTAGTQRCAGGAWTMCVGAVGPTPERCDGSVDDDCDGMVDDGCPVCTPTWTTSRIASAGSAHSLVRVDAAVGVDSTHAVHLFYVDELRRAIWRIRPDGMPWSDGYFLSETASESASLAVDASDGLHFLWYDSGLGYAAFRSLRTASGSSVPTPPVPLRYAGARNELAVDAAGARHFALTAGVSGADGLLGASWPASSMSGGWTTITPSPAASCFDIAADSRGGVHVVFQQTTLQYAYAAPGATFVVRELDAVGTPFCSVAVDGSDGVHVVYDPYDRGVVHAYRRGSGAWSIATIAPHLYAPQLAIDAAGDLHVAAVRHHPDYDLVYLRRDGSGAWTTTTVDAPSTVDAERTSIAVDSRGGVHVAYFDRATGDLRYAERSSCP